MKTVNVSKPINTRPLLLAALLAGGLAAAAGAAPARAATGAEDVPRAVVRYGDLNLRSDQGLQTLYRRIAAAAKAVCPAPDPKALLLRNVAYKCRAEAIARAVHELNIPQLAALHQRHDKAG